MQTSWQLERFRPLLRPLPLLMAGFLYLHWHDGAPRAARVETDGAKALSIALKARGLIASASDIHFIPKAPQLGDFSIDRQRAVVCAHRDDDPSDIYVVETRVAPSGALLELDAIYNLSDSSAADEQNLVVKDLRAAWAIGNNDTVASVQFADFRGEPPPQGPGWNRARVMQNALTNLQETGELGGVGRRAFKLEPAAFKVVLGFARGTLLIDADSHKISIADQGKPLEGERYIKEVTPPKARPGNFVTWAVDRVRALPWFGDERMQWLKAVAFGGRDQLEQIVSGTIEPISATGETGPGQVPRDPQVLGRFVGGFNGGFQAIHGEFGMMAERTLYLPPKPYGATVAELDDGSTAFGSWPESAEVPANIVSFRQNMTALVENGDLNPWKRHWWGGLPPGWTEESRTVRSGLCMTKEGFVGYFYGGSVDPDVLGLAMQRARCSYGIHLDMNPGHTGLEFYRTGPKGTLPIPSRKLDDTWE